MNELEIKEDIKIENMIYEIRDKQVMLDSDLAKIYECTNGTKDVNKSVKRNKEKFPDDFYFQLTMKEFMDLKFQNGTSSWNKYGGVRKLPYVFTEEGVAMLSSVLHTSVANKVSVKIMRAFVSMRHYIGTSNNRLSNIETKLLDHENSIKILQCAFNSFKEKKVNEIYFDGKIYDAYSKIIDIFNEAEDELIIIDRYTDKTILDMIKNLKCKVILITGKNTKLTKLDIEKYNKTYNNLTIIYDETYHDRYFIIDKNKIYHSGNSINHIGHRKSSINVLEDKNVKNLILKDIKKIICSIVLK